MRPRSAGAQIEKAERNCWKEKACIDNGVVIITTLACSSAAARSKESVELGRRFALETIPSPDFARNHSVLCSVTCLHSRRMGKMYITLDRIYFYASFLGMKLKVSVAFADIASMQRSRGVLGIADGITVHEKGASASERFLACRVVATAREYTSSSRELCILERVRSGEANMRRA